LLAAGIALAIPVAGVAQQSEVWGASDKLSYHLKQTVGPLALLGDLAYAGILQEADTPVAWKQDGYGYGKRFASTVACSGIHSALAFGLDSALHEDPRYYRATSGGLVQRGAHVLRGTILTRTDRGTETLSMWRFGSAYGAAYLSNQWYPGRVNTAKLAFSEGSLQLVFDLASNVAAEFWPDVKHMIRPKK